jgi:hypothetical protein
MAASSHETVFTPKSARILRKTVSTPPARGSIPVTAAGA